MSKKRKLDNGDELIVDNLNASISSESNKVQKVRKTELEEKVKVIEKNLVV